MNPKAKQRLEAIYKRFQEINGLLSQTNVTKDIATLTKLSKERAKIEAIALLYQQYVQEIENNQDTKDLLRSEEDADFQELVRIEIERSAAKILELEANLRVLLLPSDPNDNKNVIVEIRGAAGGDEANIFAGDLFRMYSRFSETQGWKIEILDAKISDAGGFTQISFLIKGKNVYAKMKFEAGSHRVQRIPKTESKGRVHTSTATVAILPEATEVDIEIKPADLKIDTYRASGAGGQHVNTTDSAVRITHIPTGIVVTSQDGRSQHDNKDKALKVLYAKIYEAQLSKQQAEMTDLRKSAVGSGQRAEKIRTYNYPQNRITDHRVNLSWQKLDYIIEGSLDEIVESLINHEQRIKMEEEN